MGVYCSSRRKNCPVRTRIVATNPSTGTTTLVTSNQTETSTAAPSNQRGTSTAAPSNQPGTSTAAPVAYPQEPVYKDTQFSSQEAPPSYTDVTALPQPARVMALYTLTYTGLNCHE